MKKITVREFSDLSEKEKERVREKLINSLVDEKLQLDAPPDDCPDDVFQAFYGCSRHYAETTGWFVPSCYFEAHEKEIRDEAENRLADMLFDDVGRDITKFIKTKKQKGE